MNRGSTENSQDCEQLEKNEEEDNGGKNAIWKAK